MVHRSSIRKSFNRWIHKQMGASKGRVQGRPHQSTKRVNVGTAGFLYPVHTCVLSALTDQGCAGTWSCPGRMGPAELFLGGRMKRRIHDLWWHSQPLTGVGLNLNHSLTREMFHSSIRAQDWQTENQGFISILDSCVTLGKSCPPWKPREMEEGKRASYV